MDNKNNKQILLIDDELETNNQINLKTKSIFDYNLIKNSIKTSITHLVHKINGTIEKTEKENILFIFLGSFFMSIGNLFLKIITKNYPNTNGINIALFRLTTLAFLSFTLLKILGKKITSFGEIEKKPFFIYRIFSNFIVSFSLANSIYYLRYGTAIALSRVSPLFSSVFSVIFLKEKCLLRYLVGLSTGFFSVFLFSYGDMKSEILDEKKDSSFLLLGLFWSFIHIFCFSSGLLVTKVLVKDLAAEIMIFYLGIGGMMLSVFFIFVLNLNFMFEFGFVFLCVCNGFFQFCAMMFNLNNIRSNKILLISCFSFLPILYAFVFGILFFGEGVTLNDLFGFCILIGYCIYSVVYPPKKEEA